MDLPPLGPYELLALKQSVQEHGVLTPIVQDERGRCIDGKARLAICRDIGLKRYPVRVVSGLTARERWHLRLELNAARRNLTRKQRAELIEQELRRTPDLANAWIASLVGADDKTVAKFRRQLEAKSEIPTLTMLRCRDGRKRPSILVDSPHRAKEACQVLQELGQEAKPGALKLRTARRQLYNLERAELVATIQLRPIDPLRAIHHCKFQEMKLASSSVDLVLTDPPWNSPMELWHDVGKFARRVLRPGRCLVLYPSAAHLDDIMAVMRGTGLTYHWMFNMYHNLFENVYGRFIRKLWHPVLVYSKGKFQPCWNNRFISDTFVNKGVDKRYHAWQRSLDEMVYFVESFNKRGELICDPCCGSGTTAVACHRLARRFVGCDEDEQAVKIGRHRLAIGE